MSARGGGSSGSGSRGGAGGAWRGLGLPLRIVVGLVAAGLLLVGLRAVTGEPTYHARLRQSAGLDAGDEVRVAGIQVGSVTAVTVDGDQVDVAFTLDHDPGEIGISAASGVEVKLLSVLGQRFLALEPGSGVALADGGTITVEHARDTYTLGRFWLDSTPTIDDLDLGTLEEALRTLGSELTVAPEQLRSALDGITGVSRMVTRRQEQLDRLLTSTRTVTTLVLDQTADLDRVLTSGERLMTMLAEQREVLRTLLREAHRFVSGLAEVVEQTSPHLTPMLRDLRRTLDLLAEHRKDLGEVLRLAGPMTRVFTNSAGDGPWLGVNAPYAILPDNLVCDAVDREGCR
ncbi:MCE family protein [Nocardioides sp. GY 10113]|uniref:MCE family protein n=1 Tax=Nocardioides sp. GY 10113 TaxID=2569761 RepID=UPI0010A945FE|nr:MCE family protein [Nocardioides sp. GY 10113]TIC87927.1 MCE family protein [Nocardioides sp. GY 10113]